jgi:hypothetical protein
MIRLFARLAAGVAAAGAVFTLAVSAGAAVIPEATFGTASGDAFLAAAGTAAQLHPVASGQEAFGRQHGVSPDTSFVLDQVAPGVFTVRYSGGGAVQFGRYVTSDFAGHVLFYNTPDLWKYAAGQLTDLSTGRVLCLAPSGGVIGTATTVAGSSTAACTHLVIVTP